MSGTQPSLLETELAINPSPDQDDSALTIRPLKPEERQQVLAWAAEDGWNPGRNDAAAMGTLDSNGLLHCLFEGKPAGFIGAVSYAHDYAVIGLYMVRPAYRGRGVGAALWRAAFAHLGERNIAVDGDPNHRESYETYGFKPVHTIRRFQGRGGGHRPVDAVDLRVFSFERVAKYDRQLYGANRPQFLDHWTHQDGATSVGVISTQGIIAGYGTVRPCHNGYQIGPLYADHPGEATFMMDALLAAVYDQPVFIDVPADNPEALALMDAHNFAPVLDITRFYTLGKAVGDMHRTYGVTGFALA